MSFFLFFFAKVYVCKFRIAKIPQVVWYILQPYLWKKWNLILICEKFCRKNFKIVASRKFRKELWVFVLAKVFPIIVITLNRIIISTLWKLHSKLSHKILFKCFQPIRSVHANNNQVKVRRFSWPRELLSAKAVVCCRNDLLIRTLAFWYGFWKLGY